MHLLPPRARVGAHRVAIALAVVVSATLAGPAVATRPVDARLRAAMADAALQPSAPGPAATTAPSPTDTQAPTSAPTTVPIAPPTTAAPVPTPAPVWAGKGMWIWEPEAAEGGDGAAIVARAVADGITTIYVRTGSTHDGLTIDWVLSFLPIAHAADIRVVGWDFPELDDIGADVDRAMAAIGATASDGTHLDGFAADIETQSEGTNLSADTALGYGATLRLRAPTFPLIACVPKPSAYYQGFYPYAEAVAGFDAIAPMVYWIDVDPAADVADALAFLAPFGKPVAPVGQSFDGAAAGGPEGMPTSDQLAAFAATARADGAAGLSFWSWQHADDATFAAIAALPAVGIG